jgi:hypothetical protein
MEDSSAGDSGERYKTKGGALIKRVVVAVIQERDGHS